MTQPGLHAPLRRHPARWRGTAGLLAHALASLLAVTLALVALGLTLIAYMPTPP